MSILEQLSTIFIFSLVTFLTRALAFLVFPSDKDAPSWVRYLGQVLPLAVFSMLVVYCLKDVDWDSGTHGMHELCGIAVTVALHLWKRNMLLSIAGGTIFYMFFIRLI